MSNPTFQLVPNDPDSVEALQARANVVATDTLTQFQERLEIMIADAERIAKLGPLSYGVRHEAGDLARTMRMGAARLATMRDRA